MSELAPEPVASTHVWCPACAAVRPYTTRILHTASRKNRSGFEANELVCLGCNGVVSTVYREAEEG